MLLSIEEIVKLLRDSVNVQYKEDDIVDPAYLAMTDEDIILFIKLSVTRIYPEVKDLEDLPNNCSAYALTLLAKIELYLKLAVLRADSVDMGADSNNYLKNDQRFSHYMKLAEHVKEEYSDYLNSSDGNGAVQTYEVLHSKYTHTKRYYENQPIPKVSLKVSNVTSDSVEIQWESNITSHFGRYLVFFGSEQIVDMFRDGSGYESKISDSSQLMKRTYDFRNTYKKFTGLTPETEYRIAVIAQCRNGVWGYKEVTIETLPDFVDDGEFDIDNPPVVPENPDDSEDTGEIDRDDKDKEESGVTDNTDSDEETETNPPIREGINNG